MTKLKNFLRKYWFFFVAPIICGGTGACIVNFLMSFDIVWAIACCASSISSIMLVLLARQIYSTDCKVLKGKKDVVDSYNDLLEQIKHSIEYYNGYDESMVESVAIYSQMAGRGIEAPIANSIMAFSQEVGSDHTVMLIGIDHLNSQWNVRVAGRAIYLSHLRAIWSLVDKHFEESAKPQGTLVIKKESSVTN
jgi:hypothetical protein